MRYLCACVLLLLFSRDGEAALPVFTDVSDTSPYFDRITLLKKRGVTIGCSYYPTMYCPNDPITRGQAAVLIMRALYSSGYGASGGNAEKFTTPTNVSFPNDVTASHAQYRWIQQMSNLQLTTSGCGGGNFCPEGGHTYAELAVFTVRAWQLRNGQSIHVPVCD